MNWRLTGAVIAGLVASAGVATAQNTSPAAEQGGKVKIHRVKVYTIADESARTLKDVEEQAYDMTDHTGTIQVASGLPATSRDFHANELEALKEHIDSMGREMARLEALQQGETPWEKQTVARATPLLKQVAATTDEAIRYVTDNPQKLALPEYRKIAKKLYDQSTALWKVLHNSVKLANLQERENRLKNLQGADNTTE